MSGSTEVRLGERYARAQIVVDLEHRQVVKDLLAKVPRRVEEAESLPELGLALLSIPDLQAKGLEELNDHGDLEDIQETLRRERRALGLPAEPSDLDVLMLYVRRRAAEQHAGWVPIMGKNRDVEAIGGLPHTGGGEGFPSPAKMAVALQERPTDQHRTVRIGVLDTGLFPNEALEGRVVTSDFVEAEEPFRPFHGHATFVCGRILQRAPGAELHLRRVLRDDTGRASSWDVAKGMASFLGSGMEILNMSLGFSTADGSPGLVMERAVTALSAEMVIVAAAGNHGNAREDFGEEDLPEVLATILTKPNSPMWPAAQWNVVAVGATDDEGEPADFSRPDLPWLDLVAPGVDVESTFLTGRVRAYQPRLVDHKVELEEIEVGDEVAFEGTARWSGTSFAAADATGEIAKLAQQPGQTARQALRAMRARRPGGKDDVHRPPRPAAAPAAEAAPQPAAAAAR